MTLEPVRVDDEVRSFGPFVGPSSMLTRIGSAEAATSPWPRQEEHAAVDAAAVIAALSPTATVTPIETPVSSSTPTVPPSPVVPTLPTAAPVALERTESMDARTERADRADRTVRAAAFDGASEGRASEGGTDGEHGDRAGSESTWPGAPEGWEPQEVDPRGLRSISWMHPFVLAAYAAVFPAGVIGRATLAAVGLVAALALATWTWMVLDNARRAKPSSALRAATPPMVGASWWLIPVCYAAAAGGAITWVSRWASDSSGGADQDVIAFAVSGVFVVGGLAALYWPYGRLADVARWTGASASAVRRWFWAPVLLAVGVFGALALSSVMSSGVSDDGEANAAIGALAWIAAIAPMGAVLVTGRRVLLEFDGAAKELYVGRSMPPIDLAELLARRSQLFDADADAQSSDESSETLTSSHS